MLRELIPYVISPIVLQYFPQKATFTQTQTEFCMQHEDKSHAPETSRPLLGPKTTSVGGLGQRKSENVGTNRKDSESFGFLCIAGHWVHSQVHVIL